MKITYLGTAAAEGFPAIFCNCRYCREARALGGKNIRTRSQSLINDNLLIDFPSDAYSHFLSYGIEGHKIKHLLITHGHRDHFYQLDLLSRRAPYAHAMSIPNLQMICSATAAQKYETAYEAFRGKAENEITPMIIAPFESVTVGNYEITALPARHMPGGEALIYVIRGDKTLLYAHDTGYFFEEVFDYIKENQIFFDMVSLDCTNVNIKVSDEGGHMGFENISRLLIRLEEMGAINGKTLKYVNHFSHNGNPLHDYLEKEAEKYGCSVAYDGCSVEF